ncbi:MAG: polysaccharide biosynthesis protein, partial [Sphaerospermopsis sp. SIO1G2]|nr:polysaccharide biosynthesis protein [Sphaerospermopsis sp. SIO1G2]
TRIVCYIIGLAVIPFGLSNITESILQAQERMYLIAISTAPIYALRMIIIIGAINLNYGINDVGIIFVTSELIIFIIQWLFVTTEIKPKWDIDQGFIWDNIHKVRTFVAIEGMGIFAAKIDILLVSLLGNELLIGIYGAMKQLLQPYFIVSGSVSLAGFPKLAKVAMVSKSEQKEVAESTISLLLFMSLPFFVSLIFVGEDLLLFIYKDSSFQEIGLIFNLLTISVITSSFSRTFNYVLTANGYERLQLVEVLLTTTVSGLAGVLLISEYKLMGAGYMSVARTITSFGTLYFAVYTRIFAIDLWKIIKLPLLITILLGMILYVIKMLNFSLILIIIINVISYIILVGSMSIYLSGGIDNLKQKLSHRFNKTNK